jgi:hypothetical protein
VVAAEHHTEIREMNIDIDIPFTEHQRLAAQVLNLGVLHEGDSFGKIGNEEWNIVLC